MALTATCVGVADPGLGALGNYGGPTETIPLLPGSPAIDAGSSALVPPGVTTDQRGLPRTVNGVVDIGAFKSQGFTLTAVAGSTPQTANNGALFTNSLEVTVTANNPVEPVDGGVVTFVANPAARRRVGAVVDLLGRHRQRPGQLPCRAQRRGWIIHGHLGRESIIGSLLRPDQHRPGPHRSDREYDEYFALPGSGPLEPA